MLYTIRGYRGMPSTRRVPRSGGKPRFLHRQPELQREGTAYTPLRPTTAYGRYHHFRDVAGQPVNAPGPLDSCIVMWRGGETIGASRCTDLLGIRLSLRHLHPNYPIDTKDSGTRGRYNWRQREELVESLKLLHRSDWDHTGRRPRAEKEPLRGGAVNKTAQTRETP